MAEYKLTATDVVIRTADQAHIPNDPSNVDRQEYDKWLAAGGVPDPYVPPPVVEPEPTPGEIIAYDHENRIRALEGESPLTLEEFKAELTEPAIEVEEIEVIKPAPKKKRVIKKRKR